MYASFNLTSLGDSDYQTYQETGHKLIRERKELVKSRLSNRLSSDGNLDAKSITEDWFPEVAADVFISHSHSDSNDIEKLAGLLKTKLGLEVFVDSFVWGHANDLLKEFDNRFCRSSTDQNLYDYEKRNISTSHIHIMLNMAILSMLDKTEAIFFYNTPNSVNIREATQTPHAETNSPWIFSEISMTRALQRRSPKSHRLSHAMTISPTALTIDSIAKAQVPSVDYPLQLDHLIKIEPKTFRHWIKESTNKGLKKYGALDYLYKISLNND